MYIALPLCGPAVCVAMSAGADFNFVLGVVDQEQSYRKKFPAERNIICVEGFFNYKYKSYHQLSEFFCTEDLFDIAGPLIKSLAGKYIKR